MEAGGSVWKWAAVGLPSVGLGTPAWASCAVLHTAGVLTGPSALKVVGVLGAKPPWKKPQAMRFALRRSPTFGPAILTCAREPGLEQSSSSGCGSPMTVPCASLGATKVLPGMLAEVGVGTPLTGAVAWTTPCVWPAMRLRAPTVDGPKLVSKELSLMAKRCAYFHSAVTVLPS